MTGKNGPPRLTWEQVLAWRMQRQWLSETSADSAVGIVRRLAGVQAQVASSAVAAVALRQTKPQSGEVDRLLSEGSLMRTWAMRGTLHLLAPEDAGAYLALIAAARIWEKSSWQRAFLDARTLNRLTTVVGELLDGRVLTREELVAGIVERTGDEALGDRVRSGWGAVLKPLAWQGIVCNGPSNGARVTFTRPDTWLPHWSGLPKEDEAASVAVASYLGAHGPASAAAFDQWLCRGASTKASLRSWFAQLGDRLTVVDVEGERLYTRTEDLVDLVHAVPDTTIRLLPAFDQYVLGPGTGDIHIIAAHRRACVSKTAGWISPVVVAGGRVVGTWHVTQDQLGIELFGEDGDTSPNALNAEVERVASVAGTRYTMSVTIV
jgi:hypothetical protein